MNLSEKIKSAGEGDIVIHVCPDHIDSEYCWCEPELEYEDEDGNQVWVHREVH